MSRADRTSCVEDFDRTGRQRRRDILPKLELCVRPRLRHGRFMATKIAGIRWHSDCSSYSQAARQRPHEIRTRRAKTLLHKQASKRPMSPAASGASFLVGCPIATRRALRASNACKGQLARGNAMKFATLVTAAFVLFVAWAGSPVSAGQRRPRHFVGQRIGRRPAGETYDIAEHRQWQRAREPRRHRRPCQDGERRNRGRKQTPRSAS